MKNFLKNNLMHVKQLIVAVLVLGSFAAFAKPGDTIDPLIHVGGGPQKIEGSLVVTKYNTALSGSLLQLGGRGISYFLPGNNQSHRSRLVITDTMQSQGKTILGSKLDTTLFDDVGKDWRWNQDYQLGTVSLATEPEFISGNRVLSTQITNGTSSALELCVDSDGTIIACATPICETYGVQSSQPASNDATGCEVGTYADTTDTSEDWKWECTDSGITIECSSPKPATNGQCGSAHNSGAQSSEPSSNLCGDGIYSNTADTLNDWQWECLGTNGGSDASCSTPRTAQNGSCRTDYTDTDGYDSEPATDTATGCTAGEFNNIADSSTHWQWECRGIGGGTTDSCSALAKVVNGQCRTYGGSHEPSPATDTATGCLAGTYAADVPQDTKWTWQCLGSGTGTDASCEENKQIASCVQYTNYQPRSSQPATDTTTGCSLGTYVDTADFNNQYQYHPNQTLDTYVTSYNWECRYGSTTGQTRECAVYTEQETGSCNTSWTGSYSSQPATNDATGCTAGTYVDVADTSTEYKWRCVGTNSGGNDNTCSADIQQATPVDVCDGQGNCVYYCAGDSTSTTGNYAWQVLQTNTAEYTNAPTAFDVSGADCNPAAGNVHPDLSTGWQNWCQSNPGSLCSALFSNLTQYDAERYYCGRANTNPMYQPGEAIDIWDSTATAGSSAVLTGARCESI
jgi:hypothetical protein